ncbi:hypothetical protein [Tenacibaculum sp.]|uniref:hypothetical protein n=2 Tax=unclassified Tenacibaculum TaxID=2635139 RepID=UPI0023587464|nr:hypothetical protein [Tenacibaculum sp.]
MEKVTKLIFSLIILTSVLLTNCKSKKKTEHYISELNLNEHLSDFTNVMSEKDTIKIIAELYMEWWIRVDTLTVTKKNNQTQLQAIIKEDTTFEMKYQWRTNKLKPVIIENTNNEFEQHFAQKIERTKSDPKSGRIYKILSPNDTLIFYTKGLGDKGGEVREYYKFMRNYYPNEKDFVPIGEKIDNE